SVVGVVCGIALASKCVTGGRNVLAGGRCRFCAVEGFDLLGVRRPDVLGAAVADQVPADSVAVPSPGRVAKHSFKGVLVNECEEVLEPERVGAAVSEFGIFEDCVLVLRVEKPKVCSLE